MHASDPPLKTPPAPITQGPKHHFFGYFEISPWNSAETHFVALESKFQDHMPSQAEPATIGLIDMETGEYAPVTETRAWNFQQGSLIHWLPSHSDTQLIFNDEHPEGFLGCRIFDIETKDNQWYPYPLSGMFHKRDAAVSLNYARVGRNRKVVGYPSARDVGSEGIHPSDDGLFVLDLDTGDYRLVVSLDEVWTANVHTRELPMEEFPGKEFWFNHTCVSPDDRRVLFLARYASWFGKLVTSMWTVKVDGSDLRCVVDYLHNLSHFGWLSPTELVATFWIGNKMRHVRFPDVPFNDERSSYHVIAPETLERDGHPTLNTVNDRWLLSDCYPDKNSHRQVYLVDMANPGNEEVHEIYSFFNPKEVTRNVRCDPHPRWSPSGRFFSFDGLTPEGDRQVFVGSLNL